MPFCHVRAGDLDVLGGADSGTAGKLPREAEIARLLADQARGDLGAPVQQDLGATSQNVLELAGEVLVVGVVRFARSQFEPKFGELGLLVIGLAFAVGG